MKQPLKVGDRVCVTGFVWSSTMDTQKTYFHKRERGKVKMVDGECVVVTLDNANEEIILSVPQCRRLVKRKRKAREFWLARDKYSLGWKVFDNDPTPYLGTETYCTIHHVREVLPRSKKPGVRVTREQLAKAWNKILHDRDYGVGFAHWSSLFGEFAKELGLDKEEK